MKMFVCVLIAVTCWTTITADETPAVLTLRKVMNEIKKLKEWTRTDKNTAMINSPTVSDIQDYCVLSALKCFRSKVIYLSVNNKARLSQRIINRELQKTFIVKIVSSIYEETEDSGCKPCDSQPMVDGHTFVENFQTLLQKIYVKQQ